jgi:hypothetical protein
MVLHKCKLVLEQLQEKLWAFMKLNFPKSKEVKKLLKAAKIAVFWQRVG